MTTRFLSFAFIAFASACSAAPVAETTGFTAGPLVSSTSDTGALHVDVRTSPQPPEQGMVEAELTVTDADGKPARGLTVGVVPWMPAMGHGTSLVPTVTELGDGKYKVEQLALFMPGEWELRLTIDGAAHDTANPAFDVP
jgi:hypothetical protein